MLSFVAWVIFLVLLGFGIYRGVILDSKGDFSGFKVWRAVWGVLLAVVFLVGYETLTGAFVQVPAGYRGIVLRFGEVTGRVLMPGGHFIRPWGIETVQPINTQIQIIKPREQASSKDLQVVNIEVTLDYYQEPAQAQYFWSQLNDDTANRIITPSSLEAIKSVTAQYNVAELISERPKVRSEIEAFLRARLQQHFIALDSVSITDFSFSPEYEASIEAKVTAIQNAEKATNDLTRIKTEAEQKVAAAEGEAQALKVQKEQITPELLQLRMIEMLNNRWDGHFPEVMSGALPMLDVMKFAARQ